MTILRESRRALNLNELQKKRKERNSLSSANNFLPAGEQCCYSIQHSTTLYTLLAFFFSPSQVYYPFPPFFFLFPRPTENGPRSTPNFQQNNIFFFLLIPSAFSKIRRKSKVLSSESSLCWRCSSKTSKQKTLQRRKNVLMCAHLRQKW